MATSADPMALAAQARRTFLDHLVGALPAMGRSIDQAVRGMLDHPVAPEHVMARRQAVDDYQRRRNAWLGALSTALRNASLQGASASRPSDLPAHSGRGAALSLVDDDTIEREIAASRLALAIMDRASPEFADLNARMAQLERREELDVHDILRAHVVARVVVDSWRSCGLDLAAWRQLHAVLHPEMSLHVEEAYHETNRWLLERRVLAEIDLRPLIRRSQGASGGYSTGGAFVSSGRGPVQAIGEETRLMTRAAGLAQAADHADAVLSRLNKLVGRQLPEFAHTAQLRSASPALRAAMASAQMGLQQRVADRGALTTPALLEQVNQTRQALKQAAATPVERATIEIVALLFQSILTEERLPASVRVWFARLQMPVLRVAVGEPDFFATVDHPARRLIDRMGACVMGFDATARAVGDALEKEIRRVVQVIEAYPDTGRRVFQTVLTEFEKFLEHYFTTENEASRKGVSLAQQLEQRETLAIQYTIELRKMLNEVPVQDGVREFLFRVWADVLAMTAVKHGRQSEETGAMKRAAGDLIWSASSKVSREERAEVIRRLPPLLKTLRDGMQDAGVAVERQDEYLQMLNNSLAAAFTARAAVIPPERLQELSERLNAIEELLPDAGEVEIDSTMVLDLSGYESSELEVVAEGGSMPTPAMLAWARELLVGSWYMLDYRGRNEAVQLAWQGLKRQLSLFVAPSGRGVLFVQHRLASFLQAGLLVPAQDEALTVKATRSALAKLDVDPSRLLN